METKKHLKGHLYAVEFFYHLERKGEAEFYSKKEIVSAIKNAIETSNSTTKGRRKE